ncbi:MAG: hypothetical protein ABIE22_03435 [archaeon]
MAKKPKSLVLFSGGLDSRLVARLLQEQTDVTLFYVDLPFGAGCCNSHCSLNFAQKELLKMKVIDATKGKYLQDYLKIIRKPKFKRGSGLNPCIDCRIFLLKLAKRYAKEQGIEIIATGEVLGERPLSQHKKALLIVEKEVGLSGKILRPLSAKLLQETEAEKRGLVNRAKFLDIEGRSRKKQIELAKKYKITYPSPAGGCLLCEKEFVKKLKPILNKKLTGEDIQLLKIGRHFKDSEIILGKNHTENQILEKAKGTKIIPLQPGPTALVKKKEDVEEAKGLIQKYTKHKIEEFKTL